MSQEKFGVVITMSGERQLPLYIFVWNVILRDIMPQCAGNKGYIQ